MAYTEMPRARSTWYESSLTSDPQTWEQRGAKLMGSSQCMRGSRPLRSSYSLGPYSCPHVLMLLHWKKVNICMSFFVTGQHSVPQWWRRTDRAFDCPERAVRILKQKKEKKLPCSEAPSVWIILLSHFIKRDSYFHRILNIAALEEWNLLGNCCVKQDYLLWFFGNRYKNCNYFKK